MDPFCLAYTFTDSVDPDNLYTMCGEDSVGGARMVLHGDIDEVSRWVARAPTRSLAAGVRLWRPGVVLVIGEVLEIVG